MEWSRETFPLCVCVCVCSRVSPVDAWVRACARVRARAHRMVRERETDWVPRWGPGGPRARERKRHQDQGYSGGAKGCVRGEGGATFCTSAGHAGVERWARLFDIRGSTPSDPHRSIRTIYTWIYNHLFLFSLPRTPSCLTK